MEVLTKTGSENMKHQHLFFMLLTFVPASFIEANTYKNIKINIIKNSYVSLTAIGTFAGNERLNCQVDQCL